jgi:hypothetical protein
VGWPPLASRFDAFVRLSILFRMPGRDPLRHNPQLHPSHRQPRQPAHRTRLGSEPGQAPVAGCRVLCGVACAAAPSRLSSAPIVLAAGQVRPGSSRSRIRLTFRAPQRMCACHSSSTRRSISVGVWLGCRNEARSRSHSPTTPAGLYRITTQAETGGQLSRQGIWSSSNDNHLELKSRLKQSVSLIA